MFVCPRHRLPPSTPSSVRTSWVRSSECRNCRCVCAREHLHTHVCVCERVYISFCLASSTVRPTERPTHEGIPRTPAHKTHILKCRHGMRANAFAFYAMCVCVCECVKCSVMILNMIVRQRCIRCRRLARLKPPSLPLPLLVCASACRTRVFRA